MNKEKKYLEGLLKKYSNKPKTKLEELKDLDKKATKGANIFAYVFGTIAILVFGLGMCMAMKVIFNLMYIGIGIGLFGMLLCILNYYIYKALIKKGKTKYAAQIIILSNELLNN